MRGCMLVRVQSMLDVGPGLQSFLYAEERVGDQSIQVGTLLGFCVTFFFFFCQTARACAVLTTSVALPTSTGR